jgi:hypothetical protein
MPMAKPIAAMMPTRPNLTPSSLEPGTSTLRGCLLSVADARGSLPGHVARRDAAKKRRVFAGSGSAYRSAPRSRLETQAVFEQDWGLESS